MPNTAARTGDANRVR